MTRPDHHDPNAQDMKPWKRYCFYKFTMSSCYGKDVTEMQSLDIFTSVAWIRAFNINEPIYAELCHEFYSTYEFDEVCADDELQTKKIIKFRLGGRAHSLTLLEFARRTTGYDKIQKNDLWLLSMFDDKHQNGYANVAWVIARWMKRKGAGTKKESQICCGQFISKIARKFRVLTEDVDLYDRMGRMEIRQEAIEQMEYRQSLGQSIDIDMKLYECAGDLLILELVLEIFMRPQYGYIKNHKKTVKNGQARTRESEEYKAEARKVKPQSKLAKKNQNIMDKSVKSSSYWPRRIREDHVQEEKAQEKLQFYTNFTLRRNTTCHITDCHAGNPCVHICDPTTLNHLAMIGNLEGHD
ncbi:hypothetical protein Tco_1101409 [Tanacetum coccineum]